jgi:NAD-dependent SIR2 family protein deacetylase
MKPHSPAALPVYNSVTTKPDLNTLAEFLSPYRKIWVLTGAGISLGSGIPTYRDHDGHWQRSDPILHQDFISDIRSRQRYWARSLVGWEFVRTARPNTAHRALAQLQAHNVIIQLVTQNVDGLHQAAGSKNVIDLHGRLDRIICLDCEAIHKRSDYQKSLLAENPELDRFAARILPDGDADIDEYDMSGVVVPPCPTCGGIFKPDVVFFGGSVAKDIVNRALDSLEKSDAVLLVGTSLQVYSGYRFIKRAYEIGIPMAAINLGVSRADELIDIKLQADCGDALPVLVNRLIGHAVR